MERRTDIRPAVQRAVQAGGAWMWGGLRGGLHWLVGHTVGPTVSAKRHVSHLAFAIGLAFVAILPNLQDPPGLLWVAAFVLLFVGYMLTVGASAQESVEGRAADIIEWKVQEQQFRRAIGAVWNRLKEAFAVYGPGELGTSDLEETVRLAAWPDKPGEAAASLRDFLRICLPGQPGYVVAQRLPTEVRTILGGKSSARLMQPYLEAKDILEIWSIALDTETGRAAALKDVISELKENHTKSLQLFYFLCAVESESQAWGHTPDFTFIQRVRDVMLSTHGNEAPARREAE